jgi:RNA polymerase sigma-70 factor (ECF subfamily)
MMAVAMSNAEGSPKATPRDAQRAELDVAVLARCRAQDPIAFRAFVVRYERPVYSLLLRLLGRGPHVEDLAQETFLRAYRAFPSFQVDADARPSAWLFTIATRLALDSRKRRTVPLAPLEAADHAASPTTSRPDARLSRVELGRAIERAAAALSDDQRAAFVLAEYYEMSLAEISLALGIPENTVKTRLFRARQHMRESLAGLVEDDAHE